MKRLVGIVFALVGFTACAELDKLSLDGTWDFAFTRGA